MTRTTMLLLALIVAATVLGGCASGPKYGEVAHRIPAMSDSEGRIFFYRDGSPFGSGVQPKIRLNDEVVGKSVPGGFFYVDRPAGSYEARCTTEAEKHLTFTLGANEKLYVRTRVTMGVFVGQVHPRLEDEEEAMKTLRKASYTGPPSALLSE